MSDMRDRTVDDRGFTDPDADPRRGEVAAGELRDPDPLERDLDAGQPVTARTGDGQADDARWDEIQATFVDDPASAVARAEALVREAIDELTERYRSELGRLQGRSSDGGASTEDLRRCLQEQRALLQRIRSHG